MLLAVLLAAGCSGGGSGPASLLEDVKPVDGPVPTRLADRDELEAALLGPDDLGSGWSVDPYSDYDDEDDDAVSEMLIEQCRPLREVANGDVLDYSGREIERRLVAPEPQHDDEASYDLEVSVFQSDGGDKSDVDRQMDLLRRFFTECRSMSMVTDGVRLSIKLRNETTRNFGDVTVTGTMTVSALGITSTLKITTVRIGNTGVQIAGIPKLVDRYAERAVEKARTVLTSAPGPSSTTKPSTTRPPTTWPTTRPPTTWPTTRPPTSWPTTRPPTTWPTTRPTVTWPTTTRLPTTWPYPTGT